MAISMVSPNNFNFINNLITKLPQKKIAQAMSICLLIYIAFLLASITWLIFPSTAQNIGNKSASRVTTAQHKAQDKSLDLSKLHTLNLFGEYNQTAQTPTIEAVVSAPETRLQLTLSGLVASSDDEIAAAVIEHKKKQATYGIDDIIEGTRATLEEVLIDRVIIKQSGRLETLMLDGADYNQPAQRVSHKQAPKQTAQQAQVRGPKSSLSKDKSSVIDQRTNEDFKQAAQQLRNDLKNNPGKITDYLRITPARKDGKIAGYRLSPGKDPAFFALSGLKSGDVAVQMNGHDLLVPLEAAQAMSALQSAQNIALLVERKNDVIEVLFSIE